MVFSLYFLDNALQDTFFIEYECTAQCARYALSVHLFLSPCSECLQHLRRGVCQKGEGQRIFVYELFMRCRAVLAYSYHIVSGGGKGCIVVAQVAGFCRASRCIVFRIKVYNRLFPDKRGGVDYVAVLVFDLELRHLVTDF